MDLTVQASALHGFFELCREEGLDYHAMLRSVGLPEDVDPFGMQYIPLQPVYDLLAALRQESDCEHIALRWAKHQGLHFYGVVGQLVASANTLGDAFQAALRYQPIYSGQFTYRLTRSSPHLKIEFQHLFQIQHNVREALELSIANTYYILRLITGRKCKAQEVCFRHAPPRNLKPYKDFFGAPLQFDAEFNGLWLPEKDLELPLPGANRYLHTILCQYADKLLGDDEEDRTLQMIKAHIEHGLPTGQHHLPEVAACLQMSPRSLQRKLQQQGYTYDQLVTDVRLELSRHYLQSSNLAITLIAENVGYKNVSTFSSAFKKHSGLTPREWRQQSL